MIRAGFAGELGLEATRGAATRLGRPPMPFEPS